MIQGLPHCQPIISGIPSSANGHFKFEGKSLLIRYSFVKRIVAYRRLEISLPRDQDSRSFVKLGTLPVAVQLLFPLFSYDFVHNRDLLKNGYRNLYSEEKLKESLEISLKAYQKYYKHYKVNFQKKDITDTEATSLTITATWLNLIKQHVKEWGDSALYFSYEIIKTIEAPHKFPIYDSRSFYKWTHHMLRSSIVKTLLEESIQLRN